MGSMGGPGGGDDSDPRNGFFNLVADVEARISAARDGADAEVITFAEGEVGLLLLIYGYNKGYLEVALENPPPGLAAPDDLLRCESFLDCSGPGIELTVLERFAVALDRLVDPPNLRWKEMARSADGMAAASVDMGRSVWEGILDEKTIAAEQYEMLLVLSLGYLLAAEAAVLGVMTAYADQDADANGDGTVDAMEDEFLELVNVSGVAVNLSGWTLVESDWSTALPRHTFAQNTELGDGVAAVVFGGGDPPDSTAAVLFASAF